jgi:hypothetical protein
MYVYLVYEVFTDCAFYVAGVYSSKEKATELAKKLDCQILELKIDDYLNSMF